MTGVISEIVDVSPFDPRSLRRRCPARSVDVDVFFSWGGGRVWFFLYVAGCMSCLLGQV